MGKEPKRKRVFNSRNSKSQCTAKSKRSGTRCKAYAAPGKDKCRIHGGATPIKHGAYSKYTKFLAEGELKELVTEFENDKDFKSLRSEIAILRAMVARFLQKIGEAKKENKESLNEGALIHMIDAVGKMVKRLVEIQDGLKLVIDKNELKTVMETVIKVIREEVRDGDTIKRIGERLAAMGAPNSGGTPSE